MSGDLRCPRCGDALAAAGPLLQQVFCHFCELRFWRLTRAAAPPPAAALPSAVVSSEASCFYHAANVAARACTRCGRFLCSLCDLEVEGDHCCPGCFDEARTRQALPSLRQQDTLFDSMALAAGWGWILVYFTWIVAVPAVLYWTIAKWRAPRGYLIPRRGWRYGLGLAGLVFWPLALVAALFLVPRR